MSGIIFMSDGFGGGIKPCLIPPFAKGIYGLTKTCLFDLSPIGALKTSEGILLTIFGLFSANNLSAKVPCFYPFESFLTAY
jgi:hypothetical protein